MYYVPPLLEALPGCQFHYYNGKDGRFMAGLPNLINVRGVLYGKGGGYTKGNLNVSIVHFESKSVYEYRNLYLICGVYIECLYQIKIPKVFFLNLRETIFLL